MSPGDAIPPISDLPDLPVDLSADLPDLPGAPAWIAWMPVRSLGTPGQRGRKAGPEAGPGPVTLPYTSRSGTDRDLLVRRATPCNPVQPRANPVQTPCNR